MFSFSSAYGRLVDNVYSIKASIENITAKFPRHSFFSILYNSLLVREGCFNVPEDFLARPRRIDVVFWLLEAEPSQYLDVQE